MRGIMTHHEFTTLGKTIRHFRQVRKLSQEAFAETCGLHRTYVCDVERGVRNVTIGTLLKIADALEITVSELTQNLENDLRCSEKNQPLKYMNSIKLLIGVAVLFLVGLSAQAQSLLEDLSLESAIVASILQDQGCFDVSMAGALWCWSDSIGGNGTVFKLASIAPDGGQSRQLEFTSEFNNNGSSESTLDEMLFLNVIATSEPSLPGASHTTPKDWSVESTELAIEKEYLIGELKGSTDATNAPPLPADYTKQAKLVAEKSAALAGCRLGDETTKYLKCAGQVRLLPVNTIDAAPKELPAKTDSAEAKNCYDETMAVTGKVVNVNTRGNVSFLDLDKPYPNSLLTAVIFEENVSQFGDLKKLNNQNLEISETTTQYRGKTPFRMTVSAPANTKRNVFGGFSKCLYEVQKFDVDTERRFAVILEDDA
jgi:transcriptional regulator with XRE-family HTH domain